MALGWCPVRHLQHEILGVYSLEAVVHQVVLDKEADNLLEICLDYLEVL